MKKGTILQAIELWEKMNDAGKISALQLVERELASFQKRKQRALLLEQGKIKPVLFSRDSHGNIVCYRLAPSCLKNLVLSITTGTQAMLDDYACAQCDINSFQKFNKEEYAVHKETYLYNVENTMMVCNNKVPDEVKVSMMSKSSYYENNFAREEAYLYLLRGLIRDCESLEDCLEILPIVKELLDIRDYELEVKAELDIKHFVEGEDTTKEVYDKLIRDVQRLKEETGGNPNIKIDTSRAVNDNIDEGLVELLEFFQTKYSHVKGADCESDRIISKMIRKWKEGGKIPLKSFEKWQDLQVKKLEYEGEIIHGMHLYISERE